MPMQMQPNKRLDTQGEYMKKKKRKLLQRITGTQKRAAIFSAACVIVLIVVIALIARLLSSDNPEQPENDSSSAAETEPGIIQEAGFFEESAYPVRFSLDGGSLRAELDGSASPDLKWEIRCEPETIFSIERDGEETDGKLSFLITPLMPGYVNLICEKNMQIGEQSYPLITIRADIIASVNQQRALEPELVDVKQIPSVFGASDTAYPYRRSVLRSCSRGERSYRPLRSRNNRSLHPPSLNRK